ncbi:energy transducer TonB [Mucilaginibacter ginkgonis]|uniref:TonB family protein n=1 Tax=Mucilaginibacter ginkgonis TaxID=2682091 RepID=A0A6I4I244_9SPHI|nr:energy transducer TonB [Mucilaginibacter ginkgonis]QQL49358.1 TonB family protein [Mucilaginibacter ginkgonis]
MKNLFTIILLLFTLFCVAQKPVTKEKAQNVYFLKKDRTSEVFSKDSADIILVVTEPDKSEKLYDVQEFGKGGDLIMIGKSSNVFPLKLEGQVVSFYPNRTRKSIEKYVSGRREGDAYKYYPSGKMHLVMSYMSRDSLLKRNFHAFYPDSLFQAAYDTTGNALVINGNGYFKCAGDAFTDVAEEGQVIDGKKAGMWKGYDSKEKVLFTERYINGKLIEGISTDSAGKQSTYDKRIKYASFRQQPIDFYRFIGTTVRYPARSRELNHQGSVVITLRVNTDGSADNFKVTHSIDPQMDAEALRAIKLTPSWLPAEHYGIKRTEYFSIPISFYLQ